jgi:FlaA1/EpsC-like NDP-sugar epimerase
MLKKGGRARFNPFKRRSPWELFRRWWEGKEWIFIGLIGLLAFIFGCHGYSMALRGTQEDHSVYSVIYWTLQLFTGQEGFTPLHYSWELQSARFMALFVLFYAAVRTIATVLRQQFENIKISRSRNHVIICGLGQKGLILTSRFREDGWRVVVIDMDENNGWHTQCRGMGALVLVGNAADRRILEKARVDRAQYVISVCGDDGANCQVTMCTRKLLPERRKRALTCKQLESGRNSGQEVPVLLIY